MKQFNGNIFAYMQSHEFLSVSFAHELVALELFTIFLEEVQGPMEFLSFQTLLAMNRIF